MNGPLIILSGPAGSGKTTIAERLVKMPDLNLRQSISATTRLPRAGEVDGKNYYFLTPAEFESRKAAGEFLEWAKVHDWFYGTPRKPVEEIRRQGFGVILVIDVQGAAQVRRSCPDNVSIFVKAPTLHELEERLHHRRTEDQAAIERRLNTARAELAREGEFTHQVLNDDLERAVNDVRTIILNLSREGSNAR
jgi:guanylate kinase